MAGLVPAIHVEQATDAGKRPLPRKCPAPGQRTDVDGRHKAGHDDLESYEF
jgi:hypothetical protein